MIKGGVGKTEEKEEVQWGKYTTFIVKSTREEGIVIAESSFGKAFYPEGSSPGTVGLKGLEKGVVLCKVPPRTDGAGRGGERCQTIKGGLEGRQDV